MPLLRFMLPDQPDGEIHILDAPRITIGRERDNTIQLRESSVSKHHAELILVGGHYLLHDLESTNLSWVDGAPVTDFHLHAPCRIWFGKVEASFSPETPANLEERPASLAPTQSEINFLKHDNRDLQDKVAALQRQMEILGEARLMPPAKGSSSIPAEIYRTVIEERDALVRENRVLKRDAANFKNDINALLRDRDALRQAWATAKADLAGAII